jgi:CDP-diacylglycerol--serine O-phosphatidyltransferase
MVSTVKFRSFKDLRLNVRTVVSLSLGLGSTAVISAKFGPAFALPYVLAVYIGIAVIESIVTFPKRRAERRAARLRTPLEQEPSSEPYDER